MTNRPAIQAIRWVSAAVLLLAALYFANLTAYHTWLAGGPPTPNPEWHAVWAERFLLTTVALAIAAAAVVWFLRKPKPSR
jgi:hypothetical protein